jgi:lathosterol oxidase
MKTTSLDPWFSRLFGDDEPKAVGSGWPGGVVAVLAGSLALGGVLCLRFPATLTAPSLRAIYPLATVRVAIGAMVALAFGLGAASALLRRRKVLGATAIALGVAALALGGPRVAVPAIVGRGAGIGLDWFLLNALVMTAVFVPLERWAPRDPALRVFRRGWSTDAAYTFVGHASIQVVSALVVIPGQLLRARVLGRAAPTLGRLPLWAQLPLVLVVADLAFYWVHRAAHHFPSFWRLHRLHHSSERMDWLASERLHLAEIVVVRALVLMPLTALGFTQTAILAYVTFASFHAVFIHANFGPSLEWLEPVLMTPRLHHLHHATDPEAIDTNFAVHLPILDRLFGTLFAPKGRWPTRTGVVGFRAPDGYWGQQASVVASSRAWSSPLVVIIIACLLPLAGLSGCIREDRITLQHAGHQGAVVHGAQDVVVEVEVSDERGPSAPGSHRRRGAMVGHWRNQLGEEIDRDIVVSEPLEASFKRFVEGELGARGIRVEGRARFRLLIDVEAFSSAFKVGFVHPEAVADLEMNVALLSGGGSLLYTRRIATQGRCPGNGAENARIALNKALDDGIETLFGDWEFASALLFHGCEAGVVSHFLARDDRTMATPPSTAAAQSTNRVLRRSCRSSAAPKAASTGTLSWATAACITESRGSARYQTA